MTANDLMTRPEVEELLGMGRSSIYRLMREGHFPEPIRIGQRAVRWRRSELEAFLEQCPRATGQVGKAAAA